MSIPLEMAASEAIRSLLSANLTALNTALQADVFLQALPYPLINITDPDVQVGDMLGLWDAAYPFTPVRIGVSPGNWRSGVVSTASREFIDFSPNGGYKNTLMNDVVCYLSPKLWAIEDKDTQAKSRLRAQMLVAGWLRQTLNAYTAQFLVLTSNEYHNTSGFDTLNYCMSTSVSRGVASLGFGATQQCYSVSATHQGDII